MNEGKLKSFFLKLSLKCKTCDYHDWNESWISHQIKLPKNPWDKIWKFCLSVFRDWRVHTWGSRKGSCETFWVYLTTGASTREQVAKLSCKESKNPEFLKKFPSPFCDWDFDSPESRENILCKLATGAWDWLDPWGKSPEQGCTVFEIFDIFQTKILSKNN